MTTTMTSLIDTVSIDEIVGQGVVACQCRRCPPHHIDTPHKCGRPAVWSVRCAHMARYRGKRVCSVTATLCGPCLTAAQQWAIWFVKEYGQCQACGAKLRQISDIFTAVVGL